MPQTRENTVYAQRLILEYNRARKLLRKYFKNRHDPDEVQAKIKEILENTTRRQSKIIGYTLNDAFKAGAKEGSREISNATISAASPVASIGFDMTKVADTHLNKITGDTIGRIAKYNSATTNQLFGQYQTLLADNKLVNTLGKSGWSRGIEKSLVKRGIAPEVISQLKGQTTTKKIVSILETQGIRGGMNPRQVSRLLQPHVSSYFGPKGVIIDNVGKFKRVLKVDVDGNYKYVKQAITRPYRATPKAYANLLARSSMIQAHHEGRYQSLQKTGLVDYYISVSLLDANTCNLCATMHGQRVSHREGPLYHPNGHCRLKPIYKKDSGLTNKDATYYENQRDPHFWKQHQLAEYNKKMPRGTKLKFHSMLPKDALTTMPSKEAMRAIRYNTLGKPTPVKPSPTKPPKPSKPTVTKEKIGKPKEVKKGGLEKMKKAEREKANELWKRTDKDGFEHAKITNSKTVYAAGDKSSVYVRSPTSPFEMAHTHPGWDAPLSGADIAKMLRDTNCRRMSAASSKRVFVASRTKDTKYVPESFKMLCDKFTIKQNEIYKKAIAVHKKKMRRLPTKGEATKIWGDSILEMNKMAAKEYKFDYTFFSRT